MGDHRIIYTEADDVLLVVVVTLWPMSPPHRSVALPDLLIAAVAEAAGLTVLHYDADFERISGLMSQPLQLSFPGEAFLDRP